jgi:hypothetical protein
MSSNASIAAACAPSRATVERMPTIITIITMTTRKRGAIG